MMSTPKMWGYRLPTPAFGALCKQTADHLCILTIIYTGYLYQTHFQYKVTLYKSWCWNEGKLLKNLNHKINCLRNSIGFCLSHGTMLTLTRAFRLTRVRITHTFLSLRLFSLNLYGVNYSSINKNQNKYSIKKNIEVKIV